jgi:hypothetical protein
MEILTVKRMSMFEPEFDEENLPFLISIFNLRKLFELLDS